MEVEQGAARAYGKPGRLLLVWVPSNFTGRGKGAGAHRGTGNARWLLADCEQGERVGRDRKERDNAETLSSQRRREKSRAGQRTKEERGERGEREEREEREERKAA